jgi:hypothetical protein
LGTCAWPPSSPAALHRWRREEGQERAATAALRLASSSASLQYAWPHTPSGSCILPCATHPSFSCRNYNRIEIGHGAHDILHHMRSGSCSTSHEVTKISTPPPPSPSKKYSAGAPPPPLSVVDQPWGRLEDLQISIVLTFHADNHSRAGDALYGYPCPGWRRRKVYSKLTQ